MPSRLQKPRWKTPASSPESHTLSRLTLLCQTRAWKTFSRLRRPSMHQAVGVGSTVQIMTAFCVASRVAFLSPSIISQGTPLKLHMQAWEGGAWCLTGSCVGCGHTLASSGVNANDGTSVWLLGVLIGGALVEWSCVSTSVGGQVHVQQAVSIYSRQA